MTEHRHDPDSLIFTAGYPQALRCMCGSNWINEGYCATQEIESEDPDVQDDKLNALIENEIVRLKNELAIAKRDLTQSSSLIASLKSAIEEQTREIERLTRISYSGVVTNNP